ncbi:MAG TPA: hypothetical protein VGN95_01530 [Pyrinomonadaceae bacterium]|nr:hypothetical protein [Pyrinomonadaceae bacterium]
MLHFKLKPGLVIAPEGARYLIRDPETESKFSVGEMEYQILKQFEERTNIEEVSYLFRTQYSREVPFETLQGFIHQAIKLNILEMQRDSVWSRIAPSTAFTYQIKLFNPSAALDFIIRRCSILLGRAGLSASLLFIVLAATILVSQRSAILSLHAGGWLSYSLVSVGFLLFAFGHEMAHGLAGRMADFGVTSIGFHLHYFMPSLNCKILRPAEDVRRSVLKVLLAGSFFDALCVAVLTCSWLLWQSFATPAPWLGMLITVMLIKIWLVQLNPFWPYSDGYHIVGLLFGKQIAALFKRGRESYGAS